MLLAILPLPSLAQTAGVSQSPASKSAKDAAEARNQPPPALLVRTTRGVTAGLPIHWDAESAIVLRSSGEMHFLSQAEIEDHAILKTPFRPDSIAIARQQLLKELGPDFEAVVSGPYIVAAPRGTSDRWRRRFDLLYSGFVRYFSLRGWKVREPDFPLRVIVFRTQDEFAAFARTQQAALPEGTVGAYFARSNICTLYELPATSQETATRNAVDWSETEATVVHEAVHQLAYNTGLHQRLFTHPLWFIEGLATMFEAREVYDINVGATASSTETERLHQRQMHTLSEVFKSDRETANLLGNLIASDGLFKQDPQLAYAGAWALTKFLSERMPTQYRKLAELQQRHGFGNYSVKQRIADFHQSIGLTPALLAKQLRHFYEQY